jgi:alkylation response protein AidB-like acyl-CoA dehydrogenase
MGRLAQTDGLTEFEQDILATVREFTEKEILPVATELEHKDEYPAQIVEELKKLGLFGLTIPETYGGLGASLAEMATKVEAAHQMMVMAARRKDSGHRNDLEAGMAKYLASEYGKEVVEDSFRIHGGYGFSKEYEIERLYREAPMLLIGEGTAEIQKMIVARRLLEDYQISG